jgi:hypothetical protein
MVTTTITTDPMASNGTQYVVGNQSSSNKFKTSERSISSATGQSTNTRPMSSLGAENYTYQIYSPMEAEQTR